MKTLMIILGLVLSSISIGQDTILTIPVPPIGSDTVYCTDVMPYTGLVQFVDYADIDSSVSIKMGPAPAHSNIPCWWNFSANGAGAVDSLVLDPFTDVYVVESDSICRWAVTKDYFFRRTCYRIYNIAASADSSIYILK